MDSGGRLWSLAIDPATGASAQSGVTAVTVIVRDAWWAEVLAKAAFVAGVASGPALLARCGVAGLVVADNGAVVPAGPLPTYLAA